METREDTKWREYCKARNQVKKMTRQIRKNIERDIAKQAKTNPKRFWNYVNSKTKTRQGISQLKVPNTDTMTESDTDKAEVLQNHFSSVFTDEPVGPIPGPKMQSYETPLDAMHITEDQILKKLKKINTAKSPGPDQLHPKLLKELADVLAKQLSKVLNQIKTGVKKVISKEFDSHWSEHVKGLAVQGRFLELLHCEKNSLTWRAICYDLPLNVLKFAVMPLLIPWRQTLILNVGASEQTHVASFVKARKPCTTF